MPHLGRPYPWPIHRDVMFWTSSANHRLARRYSCQYRFGPYAVGTCEFTSRNVSTLDVEYLYTDIMCRWRIYQPCASGLYFDLELMHRDKVEDFTWRYSAYDPAGLMARSDELPNNGQYFGPPQPSTPQWHIVGGLGKIPILTVPFTATPW